MRQTQHLKHYLTVIFAACFLLSSFSDISLAKKAPQTINDLLSADFALVKKIDFAKKDSLSIALSKKPTSFKAFTLTNPHRLVIDIQDSDFDVENYKPTLPSFVNTFRSNLNNNNSLRLVFELKERMAIKTSTFQKNKSGNAGRLVTTFSKKLGKGTFSPRKHYKIAKKVIVIDAGHGGKDPGTIGRYARTKEKNVTLSYAKELKRQLDRTKKYKVYLTRNRDFFIPLRKRVEKARKLKADLFISLHANSIGNRRTSGFSIYTLSETSSDKQAALLAKKENRADIIAGVNFSGASKEIMKTLIDLSQRDSMNNSSLFANIVIASTKTHGIRVLQNTHRFAGFAVLTAPDMSSVLIELGYLSNKHEERQLNNLLYKRQLTKSLVEAINKYFAKVKS